jgi:hypothetical protein
MISLFTLYTLNPSVTNRRGNPFTEPIRQPEHKGAKESSWSSKDFSYGLAVTSVLLPSLQGKMRRAPITPNSDKKYGRLTGTAHSLNLHFVHHVRLTQIALQIEQRIQWNIEQPAVNPQVGQRCAYRKLWARQINFHILTLAHMRYIIPLIGYNGIKKECAKK